MASDPCVSCLQYEPASPSPSPTSPTPFLIKTYELVDDPDTDPVISWSNEGNSFVIWNPAHLCQQMLPRYFKHSNFASFVRQLNTYGFHKISRDQWEFANVEFQRGQRQLLRGINRRRPSATARLPRPVEAYHSCSSSIMFPSRSTVEIGLLDEEEKKESLRKDKHELMSEVLSLEQQVQSARGDLHKMWQRVQTLETCQYNMISFIFKAFNNPGFLAEIRQRLSTSTVEKANSLPEKRPILDVDQLDASSINQVCNNVAACAGLLSGNNIESKPHSQQYQTGVKSTETDLWPRANANSNERRSVDRPPLKTLDELIAEAKLMRSAAMNYNEASCSRASMTKHAQCYHAAGGAPSCQKNDEYDHADSRPANGYGHYTGGDTRTTDDAAKDLTYNVAKPANWGNIHLKGGQKSWTLPQQEA